MTVLVLTRRDDLTADWVVNHLHRRGAHLARVDLAEFPTAARLAGRIKPGGTWCGVLRTEHQDIELEQVRAVYYRRPALFRFPTGMAEDVQQWCATEARHGLGGLLAALPHARWVNPVDRVLAAERKPVQLAAAATAGLTIPPTLITNDPEQARAFVADQPHGAVYKSLRGAPRSGGSIYPTPVSSDDITEDVAHTAHQFQARVPKAADVRVTQVGAKLFAVRIDSTSPAAAHDFRADYDNLTYTAIDTPPEIADSLRALTTSLGLVYAAHDFVIDADTGQWVYLETNANGQWAWLSCVADDIASALAEELNGDHT